jgi:formate/nitrite transporter FocA (FNT family)
MASQTAQPPQNTTALGVGFGIGIIWVVMAGTSLFSAYRGYSNDRYDWGLLWGLVGLLLLGAGTAAMVGTWWHLTRIRDD